MRVLSRYFASEIYRSVIFVLIAFLALFAFFDMMSEVRAVGQGPYRIEHAFFYVSLGLPAYAYELMPIAALIGTIYVMAQMAARSEFTVMRVSSLSLSGSIRLLLPIAVVLAITTFCLGEFIAPKCSDLRESFKRRIEGAAVSAEFRSGLWAKDVIRDPATKATIGSRFLNAKKVEPDGTLRGVQLVDFDLNMHLVSMLSADQANFEGEGVWRLSGVEELELKTAIEPSKRQAPIVTLRKKLETRQLQSDLTPELMSVLLADPNKMSAVDLALFSRHLQQNHQRSERYEIALWSKLLYPLAVFVMMALALPFAYLQARSGGLSLKIFIGIMIGVSFQLLNSLFSHIGLLNTWPPLLTAITPGALFLLAAIAALRWVERH